MKQRVGSCSTDSTPRVGREGLVAEGARAEEEVEAVVVRELGGWHLKVEKWASPLPVLHHHPVLLLGIAARSQAPRDSIPEHTSFVSGDHTWEVRFAKRIDIAMSRSHFESTQGRRRTHTYDSNQDLQNPDPLSS